MTIAMAHCACKVEVDLPLYGCFRGLVNTTSPPIGTLITLQHSPVVLLYTSVQAWTSTDD